MVGALVVGTAVGLVAAVLTASRPAVLERGEYITYDWRVRRSAEDSNASKHIIVVDIGESDLRNVERLLNLTWPWPRAFFGELANYAVKGGAKAVLLDWIFQDRGTWGVEDLEEFADAIRDNQKTAIGMVTSWRKDQDDLASSGAHEQQWLARVASMPTKAEAIRAGVQLLAWNARVFLVTKRSSASTEVFVAGPSAEKTMATWMRLSVLEELEDLFGEDAAASPPTPAAAGVNAVELTSNWLVSQRVALNISGTDDLELPEVVDTPPIAIVAEAAPALGSVSQQNDADGVVRRHAYFLRRGGKVYPSLPMAAFLLAHPDVQPRFENARLILGDISVPVERDGRVILRYHGRRIYQHINAYDILRSVQQVEEGEAPAVSLERFRDAYVIVSATARALRDITVTPVNERQLGATVNALALDNLLNEDVVHRTGPITDGLLAFFFAILGAVAVVGAATLSSTAMRGFAFTVITATLMVGGYIWIALYGLSAFAFWLPVFVPVLGASIAMVGSVLLASALERKDRRFVQEALGRYTSKELVDQLVAHPEMLSLDFGERKSMSIYFSDIAGFTSISEAIEPEQLVALLNDYLTQMTDIVLANRGVVDKYIGDAVMAFWGAPIDSDNHARQAVTAALQMKAACDKMRATWLERFGHEVYARAGINTGVAIAGNMGSKHKYNYTVMGDVVNLASRLEGANKAYGTYFMVAESTYREVEDLVVARELDFLAVKGKDEPARVFEIIAMRSDSDIENNTDNDDQADNGLYPHLAPFGRGLALYRQQQFSAAIAEFEAALELCAEDPPSTVFINRCKRFCEHPPGEDWDGVFRMKEK